MKKHQPISPRYDPPLISHFRGRAQGRVYYSMSVKKDADTLEMNIENPAIMSTTLKLALNKDQAHQLTEILKRSLDALESGKGNEN